MGLHVERKDRTRCFRRAYGAAMLIRLDKDNKATTKRGSQLHTK